MKLTFFLLSLEEDFRFIVPTFEENGIFILAAVVFFIQSIFADLNNKFRQKCFIPIEDIDFRSSNG